MFDTSFEYDALEAMRADFQAFRHELIEQNVEINENDDAMIIAIDNLIEEIESIKGEEDYTLPKKVKIMAFVHFVGHLMDMDSSFDDDIDDEELKSFLSDLSNFQGDLDDDLLFEDDETFLLEMDDEETKTSSKKKESSKEKPSAPKKKSDKK